MVDPSTGESFGGLFLNELTVKGLDLDEVWVDVVSGKTHGYDPDRWSYTDDAVKGGMWVDLHTGQGYASPDPTTPALGQIVLDREAGLEAPLEVEEAAEEPVGEAEESTVEEEVAAGPREEVDLDTPAEEPAETPDRGGDVPTVAATEETEIIVAPDEAETVEEPVIAEPVAATLGKVADPTGQMVPDTEGVSRGGSIPTTPTDETIEFGAGAGRGAAIPGTVEEFEEIPTTLEEPEAQSAEPVVADIAPTEDEPSVTDEPILAEDLDAPVDPAPEEEEPVDDEG